VDDCVDLVAGGGVTAFLLNTNALRANYASAAWEPVWSGWKGVPEARWPASTRALDALHRQGIDYPARVIARCRHQGIESWISLRMNDVHNQPDKPDDATLHSDFWRNNPQLRRQGYEGYYSRALDDGHAEVRDHYLKLIDETLDRYDIDGLELDSMREPYLFSRGGTS
jgi:uncharacterized lipoprotein YddW (UPF0748 family)